MLLRVDTVPHIVQTVSQWGTVRDAIAAEEFNGRRMQYIVSYLLLDLRTSGGNYAPGKQVQPRTESKCNCLSATQRTKRHLNTDIRCPQCWLLGEITRSSTCPWNTLIKLPCTVPIADRPENPCKNSLLTSTHTHSNCPNSAQFAFQCSVQLHVRVVIN